MCTQIIFVRMWTKTVCFSKVIFTCFCSGDVNDEDSDDESEDQRRTLKADRSHLIVWQVFTDS